MENILVFLKELSSFIVIISSPIIVVQIKYILDDITNNQTDNIKVKALLTLKKILKKDASQIRNMAINGLKILYENDNGKVSNRKIFIIALILNVSYGIAMYYSAISLDKAYGRILLFPLFILLGMPIIFYFERKAYTILQKYLVKYNNTGAIKELLIACWMIALKIFLIPMGLLLLGAVILLIIHQDMLSIILTYIAALILYFSPFAPILYESGIVPLQMDLKFEFLLIIPILSIYLPIISLLLIRYVHKPILFIGYYLIRLFPIVVQCQMKQDFKKRYCVMILTVVFILSRFAN